MSRGWPNEPGRHGLASKGIKTSSTSQIKSKEKNRPSRLDEEVKKEFDDLNELRNWLVEKLNVSLNEIYIYGSIARGDYHKDSDLDIIVNAMIHQDDNDYSTDPFDWAKKYKVWYDGAWKDVELEDSFGDHPKFHLEEESKEDAIRLDDFLKEMKP